MVATHRGRAGPRERSWCGSSKLEAAFPIDGHPLLLSWNLDGAWWWEHFSSYCNCGRCHFMLTWSFASASSWRQLLLRMAQLLLSLQTLFAKQKLTHVGSPGRRHFFETGGRSEITERRWKTDTARVVKHLDNTKSRRLLLPMIHYCKDKQDRKLFSWCQQWE